MKKSHTIALVLAGIALIAAFLVWPMLMLKLAKLQAIRKFSADDGRILNCVPSSSVVNIPHREPTSEYLIAAPPGCAVGLPSSEFLRNPANPIVFTNSDWLIACFGTLDKTNFTTLEQGTGCTNVFDLFSSAYRATVTGISKQRNMKQLRQHLALLLYKASTAPARFDQMWLSFDRGDFGGFISGDISKSDRVAVEIYLRQRDEFLALLIRRKGPTGAMSDVYRILSELRVMPNQITPGKPSGGNLNN